MKNKSKDRNDTPQSYRLIHTKNSQQRIRISVNVNDQNSEYFPTKNKPKNIENYYLDVSRATSKRDVSESEKSYNRDYKVNLFTKQQNRAMQKEIRTLRKQLQRYQKMALQKQDKNASLKRVEGQLMETYRVIQYYQSKTHQMEIILQEYQNSLNQDEVFKKGKTEKICEVIEEHRNHSIQLRVQLDKKDKEVIEVNRRIGDLELKKVQNQYQIKELTKKLKELSKQQKKVPQKAKFIDDYENDHLVNSHSIQHLPKRKLNFSNSKRLVKVTSGQSSGEDSKINRQYQNKIFVRKKKLTDGGSDKQTSVRSLKSGKIFGNFNSKLNNIQKDIQTIKKQNERLQNELDSKVNEIIKLKSMNLDFEYKIKKLKQIQNQQVQQIQKPMLVTVPKSLLKQISKPSINEQNSSPSSQKADNILSSFVSNVTRSNVSNISPIVETSREMKVEEKAKKNKEKTDYKRTQIREFTITKLIVNVIKTQLTYQQLLTMIAICWSSQDPNSLKIQFQSIASDLSQYQIDEFMSQYKQIIKYISSKESKQAKKDMNQQEYRKYIQSEIKIVLEAVIPSFKNITFRRQFALNFQLSNKFKNYQSQFQELSQKYPNKMSYQTSVEQIWKGWNLSLQEYMCFLLKNLEEYGSIQQIQFQQLGKNYLKE